jgi:hypothetical protein
VQFAELLYTEFVSMCKTPPFSALLFEKKQLDEFKYFENYLTNKAPPSFCAVLF